MVSGPSVFPTCPLRSLSEGTGGAQYTGRGHSYRLQLSQHHPNTALYCRAQLPHMIPTGGSSSSPPAPPLLLSMGWSSSPWRGAVVGQEDWRSCHLWGSCEAAGPCSTELYWGGAVRAAACSCVPSQCIVHLQSLH